MELLSAFGPIRQFHQVRDPGSVTSKGYAFCEYIDPNTAEAAILGLNGLKIGTILGGSGLMWMSLIGVFLIEAIVTVVHSFKQT